MFIIHLHFPEKYKAKPTKRRLQLQPDDNKCSKCHRAGVDI